MNRQCKVCGLKQAVRLFPKASKVAGKQYYRRECTKCYSRAKGERKKQIRNWFVELKQKLSCAHCGNSDFRVLVFHHRNPAEKDMNLGDMIRIGCGRESILAEIGKCEVLCSNCHLVVHWELENNGV